MQIESSKMSKQRTLLESWAAKAAKKKPTWQQQQQRVTCNDGAESMVVDLCDSDEDDALLVAALEESMKDQGTSSSSIDTSRAHTSSTAPHKQTDNSWCVEKANRARNVPVQPFASGNYVEDINPENFNAEFDEEMTETHATNIEDLPGFDKEAGRMWIYPTNYPVRDYQYNIVAKALYENTLVVLPTGLGKTFIAAVVMYNFYRWYPTGKIVFMAPTKPLVAQQIEACYNIMGIPQSDTAEMTGT